MLPACLQLADDLFPRVRAQAARRLVAEGWSQQRAGHAVGLSQAMVSKHLANPAATDALVLRLADELAEQALLPPVRPGTGGEASPWCRTLTQSQATPQAAAALDDLLAAERVLMASPPLRAMPQVGLNVAVAPPSASRPQEILAFPGRLIEAGARLVRPAPPAFGGSGHLARVLLAWRGGISAAASAPGALANVRGGPDVVAAARRIGLTLHEVRRKPQDAAEGTLLGAFGRLAPGTQAVHDPGAVGLEACLYVAGASAAAVAEHILRIDAMLASSKPRGP